MEGAGDTELGLDAHDSSLHVIEGTGCLDAVVSKPRPLSGPTQSDP
ncbi:hypothetical protein I547_7291 [Mycobacterium kansasii 824]|nr:hypothetical protein I547_7291 [Mycobacterium kansasii 824]